MGAIGVRFSKWVNYGYFYCRYIKDQNDFKMCWNVSLIDLHLIVHLHHIIFYIWLSSKKKSSANWFLNLSAIAGRWLIIKLNPSPYSNLHICARAMQLTIAHGVLWPQIRCALLLRPSNVSATTLLNPYKQSPYVLTEIGFSSAAAFGCAVYGHRVQYTICFIDDRNAAFGCSTL